MVRQLACAIALLASAPAAAGERIGYAPDAMALLMQDQRTTFASIVSAAPAILAIPELRSFDMRDSSEAGLATVPRNLDLSGFEALSVSAIADMPMPREWAPASPSPFALSGIPIWRRSFPIEVTAFDGGRYEVSREIGYARIIRPPRALDATLVLRIDGNADSPPLSVGGGITGALWQVIPRN
jgi:hypothetical protein